MIFRVRWGRRALDDLASLWAQAGSSLRQVITSASHTVEQRLRRNPLAEGESRPKGRRVTFEPPLTVTFRVEADGRTVSVLHIRLFRQHGA